MTLLLMEKLIYIYFFQSLKNNMGLTTLRLSVNDCLLNIPGISTETFKNKGNGLLKRLTIMFLPKLEKITMLVK